MTRIAIAGIPSSGKTTMARLLSRELDLVVRHTDDLLATHDWSAASQAVSLWFDAPGDWIIEGCVVTRALRKWHYAHPDAAPPIDKLYHLIYPHRNLTADQSTMAIGIATVHHEIVDWLQAYGIDA
jgi:dephospho-CoA kinase